MKRPSETPTRLEDVARHAGVSAGTVSNVLNHPHRVREQLRNRVLLSIEELQFVRNANASSLAAGRSASIGVVVIDLGNSLFVDIALGAQTEARAAGLRLLLAGSEDDHELQQENVAFFDEARVAGLLLGPMQDSTSQIERFTRHGRPVVLVNYDPGHEDICSVIVDNEQAGYLAAQHLIETGREKITFLGGREHLQPVHLRRLGARRAAAEAGPHIVIEEFHLSDITVESGRAAARQLAKRPLRHRPDAILAVTDTLASAVLDELDSQGCSVPDDIAVMGCDHNTGAWSGDISLSTVAMHGQAVGAAAMTLLLEELGPEASTHRHRRIVLQPELVVRTSTGGGSNGVAVR